MSPHPSELALFRRRLLRNPRQMSAIAPSSRHLAAAMATGFGPDSRRVVEFGPGTGSISRALLRAGLPPECLTLFELDTELAAYLKTCLPPGVTIHNAPAQKAAQLLGEGKADGVISGLPLLSMPSAVCHEIVSAAFDILAPNAPYVQFTYGPRPPLPDDTVTTLGLQIEKGRRVLLNLPPARVYRFRQCERQHCVT